MRILLVDGRHGRPTARFSTREHHLDRIGEDQDPTWAARDPCYDALVSCAQEPVELVRSLRADGCWIPVLVLRASDSRYPCREILDAGADDCVDRDCASDEIEARLRALVRRAPRERPTVLCVNDLMLDPAQRTVRRAGSLISLQPRKFAVLHALMQFPGEIVTRRTLFDKVFDDGCDLGLSNIDSTISHLRRAVDRPFGRDTIKTIRSVGYLIDPRA